MSPQSTMTTGSGTTAVSDGGTVPASWRELRADEDIQFEPVDIPEMPPREPTWLDRLFEFLGELFRPLGNLFAGSWPILKWVLLALLIAAVAYTIYRIVEPYLASARNSDVEDEALDWQPHRQEALALLEDADRLAAEGRFDEATRLLLQRSVGHIAEARPEWVEPSSTARELASLAALPATARDAFGAIAERVERSLFALRNLDRADWEAARSAYAEFALARLDGAGG